MPKKKWCPECKIMVYPEDHPAHEMSVQDHQAKIDREEIGILTNLFMVPFHSPSVAGNSTVVVPANPQVSLRLMRLVIPREVGREFLICDVKIGTNSYFACPGNVSAECFPPHPEGGDPVNNLAGLPVVQPGQTIALVATNKCPAAREFSALMYAKRVG